MECLLSSQSWAVRCDQSESWIAIEYIMQSTVTQSETATSERVELLKLRLQVAREASATCSPNAVIAQALPLTPPPPAGFSTTSHLE